MINDHKERPLRRLRGFIVTSEAVAMFCRQGTRTIRVKSQVPDTATFFTAYFDHSRNAFICVFEDVSFRPVPEGAVLHLENGPEIELVDATTPTNETPRGWTECL